MSPTSPIVEVIALREMGKHNEALSLLEDFLAELETDQCDDYIAALNEQSQCFWRIGKYREAEISAQKALGLAEQPPLNLVEQANALSNLGVIFQQKGELDKAEQNAEQSLILREKLGTQEDIATSLTLLGILHRQKGDIRQAEECYQRSLALRKELGNPQAIAKSLNNLGVIYWQRGELERAEEYFRRSFQLKKGVSNPDSLAVSLINLGILCSQRGELDRAEELFLESLALLEESRQPYYISEAQQYLTKVLLLRGDVERASAQVDYLRQLFQTSELPEVAFRYYLAWAFLQEHRGELKEALRLSWQARDQAEEIPHFALMLEASYFLMQILIQLYLFTNEEEHLSLCEVLLRETELLAKQECLLGTLVESVFVQGLIKRVFFDLQGSTELFHRAELLAEECGIDSLAQRAREELMKLNKQITLLKQAQKVSTHPPEETQLNEVVQYLQTVRKFV